MKVPRGRTLLTALALAAAPLALTAAANAYDTCSASRITVGGWTQNLVYDATDSAVFAGTFDPDNGDPEIAVINPSTNAVSTTIALAPDSGESIATMALDEADHTLYVGTYDGLVYSVDTASDTVGATPMNLNTIDSADAPFMSLSMAYLDGTLWVDNYTTTGNLTAYGFDLADPGIPTKLSCDGEAYNGLVAGHGHLFIPAIGHLCQYDSSGSLVHDVSVDAYDLSMNASGSKAVFIGGDGVETLDTATGDVTSTAAVELGSPDGAALDPSAGADGVYYVSDNNESDDSGEVTPVDLASGTAGAPIPLSSTAEPFDVAVDSTTGGVYVSDQDSSNTGLWAITPTHHANTPTTTSLSASPSPAHVNQDVTYTATVSPVPDAGTVAFTDGGTTVTGCGAVAVDGTGTATCDTSYDATGSHSVTAAFSGDQTHDGSTSSVVTEQVQDLTSTTTTLSVSPNPATTGQTVTMTATVSPAPPSNSVMDFYEQLSGSVNLICTGVNPVGDTFTCTTSSLAAGSHTLKAFFLGTADLATSTSDPVTETVDAPSTQATRLTLSAAHRTVTYGARDTLSGALTTDTGSGIAGRPVVLQYRSGSAWKTLATVTSGSGGTFTTSAKPRSNTVYRASFAATGSYDASTSSSQTVKVAAKVTASPSTTRTRIHHVVYFTGKVAPNERGQKVQLQRYQHHRWVTVNTAKLSRKSTFRIAMAATSHADYRWRVSCPATRSNAAGVSRSIKVTVR